MFFGKLGVYTLLGVKCQQTLVNPLGRMYVFWKIRSALSGATCQQTLANQLGRMYVFWKNRNSIQSLVMLANLSMSIE